MVSSTSSPPAIVPPDELTAAAESALGEMLVPDESSEASFRNVRTPIRRVGWHTMIPGVSAVQLAILSRVPLTMPQLPPVEADLLPQLHQALGRTLSQAKYTIDRCIPHLRQRLAAIYDSVQDDHVAHMSHLKGEIENLGDYKRMQVISSRDAYVSLLVRLVIFVFRLVAPSNPTAARLSDTIHIPEAFANSGRALAIEALYSRIQSSSMIDFLFLCFFDCDDEAVRSDDGSRWVLPMFLRSLALDDSGAFQKPEAITGMFAKLDFCARSLLLAHGRPRSQPLPVSGPPQTHRTRPPSADQQASISAEHIHLMVRLPTPYRLLVNHRQVFSSESDPLGNSHDIQWLNQDTVIVNGSHVSLNVISAVAQHVLDHLWQLLHRSLLFKREPSGLDIGKLFDNQADRTVGFSFVTDARNPCIGMSRLLLNSILNGPSKLHGELLTVLSPLNCR